MEVIYESSYTSPVSLESLENKGQLGQSKFKVYHVISLANNAHYALKSFPKDTIGTKCYLREVFFSELSHPNIIRFVSTTQTDDVNSNFNVILTEFSENGDFFDLAKDGVLNSELLIRTYFHQLIKALEYLQSLGIAHLDLKLENLLLGNDFMLKIIDFDQAQLISEKTLISGGTANSRAPEMITGNCKNFEAADIYSAGIILFAFRTQANPFNEFLVKDPKTGKKVTSLKHYDEFILRNEAFWQRSTLSKRDAAFFSSEFKELINGMLEIDVTKRFTVHDVKNSQWYQGEILSQEELEVVMRKKLNKF